MKAISLKLSRPFSVNYAFARLLAYLSRKRHECLLLSFLLLIFGNTFSPGQHMLGILDIYQNFICGLFVFYNKKRLRYLIITIIIISLSLDAVGKNLLFMNVRGWHGYLYLVFFFLISIEVFKEVFYSKQVTRELLAAALCGFVLLCLISTFLFFQINLKYPGAFANVGQGKDALFSLNYFSFTTMLTIGYGDITPASLLAKRAVMLMGLLGHFYTVFTTSIIIGKYLSVHKNQALSH
ncbi:MAG: potassium channel family protein [Chitinophagaceae bacterium]